MKADQTPHYPSTCVFIISDSSLLALPAELSLKQGWRDDEMLCWY